MSDPISTESDASEFGLPKPTTCVDYLRRCAWVSLILGSIGAIMIWVAYAFKEGRYDREINVAGLLSGAAVLFHCVTLSAILFVLARIADDVRSIRER